VRRREFIVLFGAAAAWPPYAGAQQSEKVYKIGVLNAGSRPPWLQSGLRNGLGELGWVEGKNFTFEERYAEDNLNRLTALAAELVGLGVDMIITLGILAPLAAKRATATIPIVMVAAGDPVGSGLVARRVYWNSLTRSLSEQARG
jgi:putative tryptophan/tyrosine transport system substrate-binding protein